MITITVEDYRNKGTHYKNKPFRVKKCIDSINYKIGEWLTKQQIQDLCNLSTWKVIVVEGKKGIWDTGGYQNEQENGRGKERPSLIG